MLSLRLGFVLREYCVNQFYSKLVLTEQKKIEVILFKMKMSNPKAVI